MSTPTPFGTDGPDVGPVPLEPGWYPDPWHEFDQRYWDGSTWTRSAGLYLGPGLPLGQRNGTRTQVGDRRSPREAARQGWLEAPSTVRVLFWALVLQSLALAWGGFYGAAVSIEQPSTGSGIREFSIMVWFVIMLMGLACAGVALGVHRRRAGAVVLATLMELPSVLLLPVALWNQISRSTIEATPLLVPLLLGFVGLGCALHPRTSRWVNAT